MKSLQYLFEKYSNKNIKLIDFNKNFSDFFFVYTYLLINFLILLIILPPYSHVNYGTSIYDFKTTNMHEFDDKLFYLFCFVFAPLLSIFFLNNQNKKKIIFISTITVSFVIIFFFLNALSIAYFFYLKDSLHSLGHYNFFYCAILLQILIFFGTNERSKIKFIEFYEKNKDKFLFILIIISLILVKFYSPFMFRDLEELTLIIDFKFFLSDKRNVLFFFLLLIIFYILSKFEHIYKNYNNYYYFKVFALILTLFIHFFYIDVSGEMNLHHYAPIFGPAAQIKFSSGVPGIDAHSQYGYFYFVTLSYLFNFFPATMGTTNLLIGFTNVLTLLCVILIFYQISKNKVLSLLAATLFIAFHYKTAAINFVSFPSLLGTRNLLPLLCLYFLLRLEHKFIFDKKLLFFICLSSIISFEIFLYCSLPYLSLIFFIKISEKKVNDLIKIYIKIFVTIFIFHLIINLIFFLKFNQIINYQIYFEILKSMTISNWWPVPTLNLFLLPYAYYLVYGITLIYCYHILIKIWNLESISENFNKFKIFYCTSSLGILMMIYYVSRSLPSNLQVISVPIYILLYIIFENSCINFYNKNNKIKFIFSLALIYLIFFSSLWLLSPYHSYNNTSTFLKKCLSKQNNCNLKKDIKKIVNKKHNFEKNSEYEKIVNDSNQLIKSIFKKESKVLFFSSFHLAAIPEIVLANNKKWHFHPFSFLYSDELSFTKINKLIAKNQDLKEGMSILILSKYKVQRLEQLILTKIKEDWNLCNYKIDSKYYKYYKLSKHECENK